MQTTELKELKWLGSPISKHAGTINEIITCIPEFERRPFSLDSK